MPILGVIASSTRQGQNVDTGAMFAIQTISVGSAGAANITFNNIPSTYKHLQLRIMSFGSAEAAQGLNTRYNGDTNSNYSSYWLYGNGSTVITSGTTNDNIQYFGFNLYSSFPTISVIDILDYANANKYKTMRCISGNDRNGAGTVWLFDGAWRSNSAITSITITPNSGNFNQNSQFILYGVKGA